MIESDRELSTIAQELWDSDTNRLKPGKDYRISLQVHYTHTHSWHEAAPFINDNKSLHAVNLLPKCLTHLQGSVGCLLFKGLILFFCAISILQKSCEPL